MRSFSRALFLGIASLALLLGLIPPPAAQATPPEALAAHTAVVSVTEYKAMKLVAKAAVKAEGNTLDYRKATKVFGSSKQRVDWRRQFGAGWLLAGRKLSHVSTAERRKIEEVRRASQPPSPNLAPLAPNCQGRNGREDHPRTDYDKWFYFDSCSTNKIIRNYGWCVGVAALVTALVPHKGVAAVTALAAAACGGVALWVTTARDNSSLGAIIIKTGDTSKYHPQPPTPHDPVRWHVPVRMSPQ